MTDSEDDARVPVQCDVCETRTRVPLSELAESIERHNEDVHDGEPIAEVDPDLKEQLANLVVDDMGLLEEDA
ncbi:hypothetical protein [Natronosalvus vescus]|uniref:hypothetical protein n=1 Tax=Natronosalvus vescus TaxID=2953881 RepID=UPI00209019F3|nr:hypothetical protein [Natronosalvus vescus]